jgi:predicted ATPase
MARKSRATSLAPPFLRRVWMDGPVPDLDPDADNYPLDLPMYANGNFEITFEKPVTILVGANGAGKSTLLEAIAALAGFSDGGGGRDHNPVRSSALSATDGGVLADHMRAAWLPKLGNGFFFRAETFFSLLRYIDDSGSAWGGHLHRSHGEGFLSFFEQRTKEQGLYIFDEPESALAPDRQFEFLKLLRQFQRDNNAQVIMATHSPILMALPDADLLQIDQYGIRPVTLEETAHFRLYKEFIAYPHLTVEAMIE